LVFETNVGQADEAVDFLSRGPGYTLLLTAEEAVMTLARVSVEAGQHGDMPAAPEFNALRMRLVDASASATATALDRLGGHSNYFLGADPQQWLSGVEHFGRVHYDDVYAGVDVVYYGTRQGQLEYDFVVEAGADAAAILLEFAGAEAMELAEDGALRLAMSHGTLTIDAPIAYQHSFGERIAVAAAFVIRDDGRVQFEVGPYDSSLDLVIDPVIHYATYLGGSAPDRFHAVAVDGTGAAYVIGTTSAADFPLIGEVQGASPGTSIIVAKFAPDGQSLLYSTYLGGGAAGPAGADLDFGWSIDVDAQGRAYLTGRTESADFPTTAGALQPTDPHPLDNDFDAFVARLSADGSELEYSTYLGGSGNSEIGNSIVVDDATGNFYVAGSTNSLGDDDFSDGISEFPLLNSLSPPDAGDHDAFVSVFAGGTDALMLSTFVGGSDRDEAFGIALDSLKNIVVTGRTHSFDFLRRTN
jgi:hypothetical protein